MPLPRFTDPDDVRPLRESHRLLDLHFHTRWSDGLATPAQAVDRARELDLTVAITDHNVIEGALEAWLLAGHEAPRRVIPGIEITTRERIHLLIYFRHPDALTDFYRAHVAAWRLRGATATTPVDRPVHELLAALRDYDHLTSAAHPYAAAKNGLMSVRERFAPVRDLLGALDALEVLNGEELARGNARSAQLAREVGLGVTAGSDGHTLIELGQVCMAIEPDADPFEAVRSRSAVLCDLRRPGNWRRLMSHTAKAPYFARRPGRFALRWARGDAGHGPLTTAGVLSSG